MVGCNESSNEAQLSPVPAQVSKVSERYGTRVYLTDDCPVVARTAPRGLGAIGLALAPVLVDGAMSAVERYLREREAALTGTHAAHALGRLYNRQGDLGFGCIVIVRGTFGAQRKGVDDNAAQGSLLGKHLVGLGLATFPDFYFEAWASLEPSGDDQTHAVMKLTPQVLQLARTGAKRWRRPDVKTVNILLLLSRVALDPSAASAVSTLQHRRLCRGNRTSGAVPNAVA